MGLQFARKRMVLPPPGKPLPGKERRMKRDFRREMGLPMANAVTRTTAPKTFGPGTRVNGRGKSEEPDFIDLSMGDDDQPSLPASLPPKKSRKISDASSSNCLAESVRHASTIAPDLSHFRYAPSNPATTEAPLDPIQSLYQKGRGFTLKRDLPPYEIPVCSMERRPSEDSVIIAEEKKLKRKKNEYGFRVNVMEPVPTESAPQPPQPTFKSPIRPRVAYPTPARAEKTNGRDSESIPAWSGYFTPARAIATNEREQSVLSTSMKEARPTTMRALKKTGQVSRLKEPTPAPYKLLVDPTLVPASSEFQFATDSMSSAYCPPALPQRATKSASDVYCSSAARLRPSIEPNLTLADIPDPCMRMKVAQLMAIAPDVPIQHLYGLIIKNKSRYLNTREQVSRYVLQTPIPLAHPEQICQPTRSGMSKDAAPQILQVSSAPTLQPQVSQASQASRPPARPLTAPTNASAADQNDDDDMKTKIDFNYPDIWLENDMPDSPPPSPVPRRKPQSKKTRAQPKKSQPKSRSMPAPSAKLTAPASKLASKQKAKSGTSTGNPANVNVKRSNGARRNRRSNSIDRDFIIPVDESDLDGSYQDTGSGCDTDDDELGSDVAMEDFNANLHIDMIQPFYIPNSMDVDRRA